MHLEGNLVNFTSDVDVYMSKVSSYVSIEYRQLRETLRYVLPTEEERQA